MRPWRRCQVHERGAAGDPKPPERAGVLRREGSVGDNQKRLEDTEALRDRHSVGSSTPCPNLRLEELCSQILSQRIGVSQAMGLSRAHYPLYRTKRKLNLQHVIHEHCEEARCQYLRRVHRSTRGQSRVHRMNLSRALPKGGSEQLRYLRSYIVVLVFLFLDL